MRIFLTHILPEHFIQKYKLNFAAYNFSSNLISGGGFDKVYNTLPLSVSGKLEEAETVYYELIYSSLRQKGGICLKLATLVEQWTLFKRIPHKSSIWFYNIGILNALLFVVLRIFKPSVKINIIELDFTPPTSKWCAMAWFLRMMNKADGVIKLADSPLFTNQNTVCLAGVTPKNGSNAPLIKTPM